MLQDQRFGKQCPRPGEGGGGGNQAEEAREGSRGPGVLSTLSPLCPNVGISGHGAGCCPGVLVSCLLASFCLRESWERVMGVGGLDGAQPAVCGSGGTLETPARV